MKQYSIDRVELSWQGLDFKEGLASGSTITEARVAPSWNLPELHTDMKWDFGFGLRFMAKKSVIRIDLAWSEEGSNAWVMIGEPFGSR